MAFRAPDTQGRKFYAQAASSAPSTASLLPPPTRGPQTVQAAFARAPPSIRSIPSLNSLVRIPPVLPPPPSHSSIFPERLPVLWRNRWSAICSPSTVHLRQGNSPCSPPSPPLISLLFSSPSHPIPSPGAPISPQITPSLMTFSTIPIHGVIESMTVAAACSRTEA